MAELTPKTINELPEETTLTDETLFAVSKNATAKKFKFSSLKAIFTRKTGDTMTGNLIVNKDSPGVSLKASDRTDTVPPSKAGSSVGFRVLDKNGAPIAIFNDRWVTDGRQGAMMVGARDGVANSFSLFIDADGKKSVHFSAPEAWEEALGLVGLKYKENDTFSPLTYVSMVGTFVSSKVITFPLQVDSSMENITNVVVTRLTGGMRTSRGDIDGKTAADSPILADDTYTVTATKVSKRSVRITLKKSTAISQFVNREPIAFMGYITLKFT